MTTYRKTPEAIAKLTPEQFRVILKDADAAGFLADVLVPLWKVQPSPALYGKALELQARQKLSFHDSLVVAAALQAGCRRLLTEDLQHGQRVEGLQSRTRFAPEKRLNELLLENLMLAVRLRGRHATEGLVST